MAYVKCHGCQQVVHFRPVNVLEFHKKYIEENQPIYCFSCFKKREEKENNV